MKRRARALERDESEYMGRRKREGKMKGERVMQVKRWRERERKH